MMLQLLTDVGISGSWLLVLFAAIIGFFFIRTLNRIEKNSEEHTRQIQEITKIQIEHSLRLKQAEEALDGDNLAEKLIDKIRAITPPDR